MRISRPCYDKMHRCPGWAGGGMRYAKKRRCYNGRLPWTIYDGWLWRWRTNRCTACGMLVLPYMIRYVDPYFYWSKTRWHLNLWLYRLRRWWSRS